tara:strand:+ start:10764 stop:11876 length:1113 start_codon:yes stop_codon:yes gene_type:complete
MSRVLIVGAGRQGRAIAYNLSFDHEIILVDNDPIKISDFITFSQENFPESASIQFQSLDASKPEDWSLMYKPEGIVNAASYMLSEQLTSYSIKNNIHYVDLGGNPDIVSLQHKMDKFALKNNVSIVPDCGLAPGLSQLLASYGISRIPNSRSVKIYCGGLPKKPLKNKFKHYLFFAAEGLLNEYCGSEIILEDGELKEKECLEGKEVLNIDQVGKFEASLTRGGISTAAGSFYGVLDNYRYKTLRWPGHWDLMLKWKEDGFFKQDWQQNALAFAEKKLGSEIPTSEEDMVVLLVQIHSDDSKMEILLIDKNDVETGLTSMERTTGFPAAEIMRLAIKGDLKSGVLTHELDLPSKKILRRLEKVGLKFKIN